MKRLSLILRDGLGLFLAGGVLAEARSPSPVPGLLLLTVVLAAVLYVLVTWLERRYEATRREEPRPRHPRTPADAAARRGFKSNGIILLRDHVWDGSQLDHVSARWPTAMRGYYFVWPGRHRIVGGGDSGVVLDFVLYPDEIFIRRLHPQTGLWLPEHPENEAEFRKLAQGGPFGSWRDTLVDYLQMASVVPSERREPQAAQGLLEAVKALLARVEGDEHFEPVIDEAAALGETLIGVPLTADTLHAVTRTVIAGATRLASRRAYNQGLKVLDVGLRILPDDPFLLEVKSNLLADLGLPEEALRAIERTLCRDQVLRAEGMLRARATKAQILAQLGRYAEARALLRTVLKDRPDDARAQQINADLANHESD